MSPLRNRDIEIDRIDPSRKLHPGEDISSLANSIRKHGVLQPVRVHEISCRFHVIYGNRRFYAAIQAGLTNIPCIVVPRLSDKDRAMIDAVEDFQRKIENPIIRAKRIKNLIDLGHKPIEIARELNLDKSTISRLLILLKLHPDIQEDVAQNKIDYRRAADLARIEDLEKQLEVYRSLPRDKEGRVIATRSQIRNRVNSFLNRKTSRIKKPSVSRRKPARPTRCPDCGCTTIPVFICSECGYMARGADNE